MSAVTPRVGHPDYVPGSNRMIALQLVQDPVTPPAGDLLDVSVAPDDCGDTNSIQCSLPSGYAIRVEPTEPGGLLQFVAQEMHNPATDNAEVWIPFQHYGDGVEVSFINPTGDLFELEWNLVNYTGSRFQDLILPYVGQSIVFAGVAHGTVSALRRVDQAAVYDRMTITAIADGAATLDAVWTWVYLDGTWQKAEYVVPIGNVAAAGTITADLEIRTSGLALRVHNDAGAGAVNVTVFVRLYRLSS